MTQALGLTFLAAKASSSGSRGFQGSTLECRAAPRRWHEAFRPKLQCLKETAAAAACTTLLALRQRRARGLRRGLAVGRHSAGCSAQAVASEGTAALPPILVVNLDRSPARWESCKEEFAREALQVERFSATDGKLLTDEELQQLATGPARLLCTKGMLGCFLSHRRIWQKVVDEKLPAAIALEDDVRLVDGFQSKLSNLLAELPEDWEVCLLGAVACVNPNVEPLPMKFYSFCVGGGRASPGKTRSLSPHVSVPHRPAGTHAYIVSQRGAERLLKELPRARYHVDLAAWALPELKLYVAEPQLATQDFDEDSTVSKSGEPFTQKFLRWCWTISGMSSMSRAGGVPNLEWAWKAALFALPLPGGKRVPVEMGPMSSVFVLLLVCALAFRSRNFAAAAVVYQGLTCSLIRYLCGTWRWRFLLGHLLVAAAIAYL
eukprot:TRINITY_DN79019_c0_g1_i1.p1 TRINITY_DN79019_c0_g1~~TRINITY_DN79019_c0_g1_i1.p1  ORF type:complete len:433 (+),score=80.97 TRINITY_DN79019_c0_g1_i1:97-1395(+)